MPTPRAIITASVGAKSAMSKTAEAANTSAIASPIAANATISGMVIAASDPSTSTSTTMATAMPMSSPAPCGACSATWIAWPPSSTSRPRVAPPWAVSTTRWTSALSSSLAWRSKRTVANATRPSRETAPGPANGLCTAATCGRRPTRCTTLSICAWR